MAISPLVTQKEASDPSWLVHRGINVLNSAPILRSDHTILYTFLGNPRPEKCTFPGGNAVVGFLLCWGQAFGHVFSAKGED